MTRSQEMQLHLKSESNLVAVHDFGDSGKCINFRKSDRCDKVSFTWAALPGAHILTDVHPTNCERSNSMACRDS